MILSSLTLSVHEKNGCSLELKENISSLSPELSLYIAALHDIISAYHTRLSSVASPKVANQFLANIADMAMHYLGYDKNPAAAMEKVKELMAKLGMEFTTVKVGGGFDCRIGCPFAEKVHPHLAAQYQICPTTLLVLGAIRLEDKNALPTKVTLTETGTVASIRPSSG